MGKDRDKNLKDTHSPLPSLPLNKGEELGVDVSYTKTNKLISALYMVTDIIDKEEPIRSKLRTLGTEIVSDMNILPLNALTKISQSISFLDIASSVNIISSMNCNILRKEFLQLYQSIKESSGESFILRRPIDLSEFFMDELPSGGEIHSKGHDKSIGHLFPTRLGVQKASTLMKALSVVEEMKVMSDRNSFEDLKKQRRDNIVKIIKLIGGSATITNIRDKVKAVPDQAGILVSCSEKTLQRELMSMTKDGVLNKTGEKRWSRYFIRL